jgi:uncharacterized protein YoxC
MDDAHAHQLTDAILLLALELKEARHQLQKQFEFQVAQLATKHDLAEMEKRIMALLDDIQADVEEETTVIDSVVTLLNNISQQLKDAGTDPVKLQAIKDAIDKNKATLAAAVAANTPTPPTP